MDQAKESILKLLSILTLSVTVLTFYSCPRYPTYTPPPQSSFDSQDRVRTINKGFDEVWTALIEYVSSTFFAIKSFEKASGLLTLQFGSGNPAEFVDCGYIKSVARRYEGPVIGGLEQFGSVSLDGAMNIFVKRISDNVTQVRISARYILQAKSGPGSQTWAFDTGGSDTKQLEAVVATCQPTHKAERTILDGIDQIAHQSKP
jgi:hypothetical protein